jgi:plastocyanin
MAITRIGVVRPAANTATTVTNFSENYLVSVIATNVAPTSTPVLKITIYIIPAGATLDSQYAYITRNLTVPLGNTFETFRFAVNPGDSLVVLSTTPDSSISVYGILQDDVVGQGDLPQTFTNKVIRGNVNTFYLDRGTTAQRNPAAEIGYARFNTELDRLELRTTTGWDIVNTSLTGGSPGGPGPTGPEGPTGPTGPAGADGTSLLILGVAADVESLPSEGNSVGDIYIVEADGEAYVWDGDSWESIGTITGPAGEDGATGPAGDPGPTGPAGADGADGADGSTTFNGTTDATLAGITINEIAYSAITRLEVTNSGATAYLFNNQYSGNNPTIYAISGTTIAFNLNVEGHPFLIRVSSGGSNYDTGLIHVATDGTVSTGSSAQGKVTGTLYWQVPANISGNYVYQCSIHSGMVGTITIKDISTI